MKKNTSWISPGIESVTTQCRLFCIPYAGGNSSIFRNWKKLLPPEIAVHPIELPGKGRRFGEIPYSSIEPLVKDLTGWFLNEVKTDFVLFGHSLGALISFELAKQLEQNNKSPKLLVLSGCCSPSYLVNKRKSEGPRPLSNEDLIHILKHLNGTPEEVLRSPDFTNVILPIFRADISMYDTYSPIAKNQLTCPLLVFGGNNDAMVPLHTLEGWKEHSLDKCTVEIFNGNHFFIHSQESFVTQSLKNQLS